MPLGVALAEDGRFLAAGSGESLGPGEGPAVLGGGGGVGGILVGLGGGGPGGDSQGLVVGTAGLGGGGGVLFRGVKLTLGIGLLFPPGLPGLPGLPVAAGFAEGTGVLGFAECFGTNTDFARPNEGGADI